MSGKIKVLVVEDEYILFDQLCEFFETKGYVVLKLEDDRAVDNYEDAVQLMKQQKPDIAILDIQIKGAKDGIDLGEYIKKQYRIPVIYLSAHPNPGNLERLRMAGDERFILKASKPFDEAQLWTMFYLALPKASKPPTNGKFFSVKELTVAQGANQQRILLKKPDDPLEIETYLKWKDIVFVEAYNAKTAGSGNNNILIHTVLPGKAYMLRGSLTQIEQELPDHFARFDQSTILNVQKITGWVKGKYRYLINDLEFKLSESYRAKGLEKIERFLDRSGLESIPD